MLPTGCRGFDLLLGGGILNKIITQLYGPAGSGKTNICLQMLCSAAKLGKKVLYIDSEGGFSAERLKQIAGDDFDRVLKNTMFAHVTNFVEQADAISKIEKSGADVVIVDSITALYRLELGENFQEINRELGKQLAALLAYGRKKDVPVLVTNQVYSNFESGQIEPVGGDVLKYASKVIIELQKCENSVRRAILRKHLHKKEGSETFFSIVEYGLIEHDGTD